MGRTAAQETAEATFNTQRHPGQHVNLQQLQQTLPLKDWTVRSQQVTAGVANLTKTNPRRNYHSLPRLTDANATIMHGSVLIFQTIQIQELPHYWPSHFNFLLPKRETCRAREKKLGFFISWSGLVCTKCKFVDILWPTVKLICFLSICHMHGRI